MDEVRPGSRIRPDRALENAAGDQDALLGDRIRGEQTWN